MSKLLYNDHPLVVSPALATLIGLNEAIVLQQVHYWIDINTKAKNNLKDGFYWTYNSGEEWGKQFPFWCVKTIRRILKNLEKMNLIITDNFNKMSLDRTLWYRINYPQLDVLENAEVPKVGLPCGHPVQMEVDKLITPIPETIFTETTTENNYNDNGRLPTTAPVDKPFLKDVKLCTTYYLDKYRREMGKEHPSLKKRQWDRIYEEIGGFVREYGLDFDDMVRMIDKHFNRGIDTDYNINHFATEGILTNLMYMEAY